MDACSRLSVSKCVTSCVERESIPWGAYSWLGHRYKHPCLETYLGDFWCGGEKADACGSFPLRKELGVLKVNTFYSHIIKT